MAIGDFATSSKQLSASKKGEKDHAYLRRPGRKSSSRLSPSAPSRCRSRRRRQLGPKLPNSQMNFEAVALYGASRARGLKPVGNQAREASKRRWL